MPASMNTWANISAIAQDIQEDAIFLERHMNLMGGLVKTYRDASGANDRKSYQYNQASVSQIAETDDLTSQAFTPSHLATLSPFEYGAQFFITDLRIESESPDDIRNDGALELGLAMASKVEADLLGLFGSLTGGTIDAGTGTALTWGHVAAGIARARVSIKNQAMPLAVVVHEYQYYNLGKSAAIAGSSNVVTNNEAFIDPILRRWYRGDFAGASIFVSTNSEMLSGNNATGAVFGRDALAIDWRRAPRIEPERDASRRGYELNLSAVYAKGVWRPTFGVQLISDAQAPSS
jgi:hypothetical protein